MVTVEEGFLIPKISEECSTFINDNFSQDIQDQNNSRLSNDIYILHSGFSREQKYPEITVIMDHKNKDWLFFRRYDVEKLFRISQTYANSKRVMTELRRIQQKQG